jgi:hypothetical protein
MHNRQHLQGRIILWLAVTISSLLPDNVPDAHAVMQRADTTVVVLTRPEHPGIATLSPENGAALYLFARRHASNATTISRGRHAGRYGLSSL